MTEFQSKFTGQEVDNTINKLRNWIAVDDSYPSVTISGITYAVIWKSIPTSGTPCYGIGLHPTTGRLYEIYYDGSSYTAKAFSVDGHTHETEGSNDSFNLGYYDTIVENSDGTYTITRQTGYLVLDGTKNKFDGKFNNTNNEEYYYNGCINYISKPLNTGKIADIISNTLKTVSADNLYVQNIYGIAVDTAGAIIIGLTTSISTLEDANAWLVQNPASIQYKLATATTEKVEKNHYARYNERFILEHNKSEAERSANLLDIPNKTETSVGVTFTISDGVVNVNGSSATSAYPMCEINSVELQVGTYTINKSVDNSGLFIWVGSNPRTNDIVNTNGISETFTITTNMRAYICIVSTQLQTYSNFKFSLMLNEGSVALPYQPYEGKVMHEKDISNMGIIIEDLTGN